VIGAGTDEEDAEDAAAAAAVVVAALSSNIGVGNWSVVARLDMTMAVVEMFLKKVKWCSCCR
jgi:hypothetical protein